GVVLATGDRLPAHAHVACLSRRGGGHGRALARQLSRAGGYPARAWLVPSGGLSAEPRPLRTSRPGGVRRLAAQDECAVRRAHVGAARLQLTRGSAVAPERALQAEGGTANGEPDRLRRSVPTAADQPARTCAEARLYVDAPRRPAPWDLHPRRDLFAVLAHTVRLRAATAGRDDEAHRAPARHGLAALRGDGV